MSNYHSLTSIGEDTTVDKIKSASKFLVPAAGAILGALSWKEHAVLGGLGGYFAGDVATGLATSTMSQNEAVQKLGSCAVATASALSLHQYPYLGYAAGMFTSGLLIKKLTPNENNVQIIGKDSFLSRPVKAVGNRPVWQVALGGTVLLGLGLGAHKIASAYLMKRVLGTP